MIQYFQLTPEILLEYIYEGDPKIGKNIKDIYNKYPTMLLSSSAFGTKYLCFKNESEGWDSFSNLVLPLNNTETQFVVAKNEYHSFFSKTNISNRFYTKTDSGYIYENTNYDNGIINSGNSCDVKYDKCIIHFTSKNHFGNYDALIFQAYVYMKNKAKFYLTSFLFERTQNRDFKEEHMLYNEKLYTTQIEFDIPSIFAIFTKDNVIFNEALKSQNIDLLDNTPIGINVYGVSGSTVGVDKYERLKTFKINTISIPQVYNRLDEIHVDIKEAEDGDYYIIDPQMSTDLSFVDYIESMGEDVRSYMIMHELSLREIWMDENGNYQNATTHKEYHIIDINEDDEDEEISRKFDARIKYRPICTQGGLGYKAIIVDTIKIINSVDSSSYEVTGSLEIANPHKYGKRLKKLDIKNDSRPIINVYNKKVNDENNRNLIGMNRNGGFVVENMTQNITSFIECTNIGVSILELSPEDIN